MLGAAILGVASAGLTGLLVHGESQTMLRGGQDKIGAVHFWLGFGLAGLLIAAALSAWRHRAPRRQPAWAAAIAVAALIAVTAQGYLGGRMTYEHGVGVYDGGALAQTARGTANLELALDKGTPATQAGRAAFSTTGLGCAACHGNLARGGRGPSLAGGRGLDDFRRVHGHGLFPPAVVTDRDYAAIVAYLRTLPGGRRG